MKTTTFLLVIFLLSNTFGQSIIKKVYTDKARYAYGETVMITIRAINSSPDSVTVVFPDMCEAYPYVDGNDYLSTFGLGCALMLSPRTIPPQDSLEWIWEYPYSDFPDLCLTPGTHSVFGFFRMYIDSVTFTETSSDTISFVVKNNFTGVSDETLQYKFSLEQNYPNPFNPETTIKYSIPKTEHVKLTVFNILGENVATLVNKKQAAGDYSVKFNAFSGIHKLPSGVYFYKLQSGNFTKTRKLILLK
jgi:hypothetical protein